MKLTLAETQVGNGGLLRDMAGFKTTKALAQAILDKKVEFMPLHFVVYDGACRHVIVEDGKVRSTAEKYVKAMRSIEFESDRIEIEADYFESELAIWLDGRAKSENR